MGLLERNGRPDHGRLHRPCGSNGNHDGVASRIEERIGVELPVAGHPEVARRIDCAPGNPDKGITLVSRRWRDRLAGLKVRRALRRVVAAEPADTCLLYTSDAADE